MAVRDMGGEEDELKDDLKELARLAISGLDMFCYFFVPVVRKGEAWVE